MKFELPSTEDHDWYNFPEEYGKACAEAAVKHVANILSELTLGTTFIVEHTNGVTKKYRYDKYTIEGHMWLVDTLLSNGKWSGSWSFAIKTCQVDITLMWVGIQLKKMFEKTEIAK